MFFTALDAQTLITGFGTLKVVLLFSSEHGGLRGGGSPPATTFPYDNQKAKRPSGARGGAGGRGPPATINHYYNIIFTTIFYNNILQLFSYNLNKVLNSLTNIIIINIIINSEFVQTLLLSNQIRCWEGGMGGGYPLPNHLIWLDNKYNIYPLIYIHSYNIMAWGRGPHTSTASTTEIGSSSA